MIHLRILGRHFLLLPAAAVAGVTLLQVSEQLFSWRYNLWKDTSASFHSSLQLTGPVAAAGAAWMVSRTTRRTNTTFPPWSLRAGTPLTLGQMLAATGALGGTWIIVLLLLVARTTRTATYGSLQVLPVIYGISAFAMITAFGLMLGRLLPAWLAPPVTAVVVFLALSALAASDTVLRLLSPVRFRRYTLDVKPNPELLLFVTLVALLTCSAFLAISTLLNRRGFLPFSFRLRLACITLAVGPLLTASLILGQWRPLLNVPAVVPPATCDERLALSVCLHPALERDLPAARTVVALLLGRYGPHLPSGVSRVVAGGDGVEQPGDLTFALRPRLSVNEYVLDSIVPQLTGRQDCRTRFAPVTSATYLVQAEEVDVADAVQVWLGTALGIEYGVRTARGAALASRLTDLPDVEVTEWIQRNRDKLYACDVKLSDLP